MSYTRPSASAADATWLGAAAYTRPAQSAADATWAQGAGYVAGWNHTAFGSPSNAPNAVGFSSATNFGTALGGNFQRALGFSSTSFGTPGVVGAQLPSSPFASFGIGTIPLLAEGWSSTAFGGPDTPLFATGAIHTVFGDSQIIQYWQHRGPAPATRFGTPYIQQDAALDADGSCRTAFGLAAASSVVGLEVDWVVRTFGFDVVAFGHAAVPRPLAIAASGARRTLFGQHASETAMFGEITRTGTHRAGYGLAAQSEETSSFGHAALSLSYLASGLRTAGFGHPTSGRLTTALPASASVHFGACVARHGFVAGATGREVTEFGSVGVSSSYRARHTAPGARFGRPQLVRSNVC